MTDTTLLRLDAVMGRTGMKRAKLYAMVADGRFPEPMKIDGCSVWPSNVVQEWIDARVAAYYASVRKG